MTIVVQSLYSRNREPDSSPHPRSAQHHRILDRKYQLQFIAFLAHRVTLYGPKFIAMLAATGLCEKIVSAHTARLDHERFTLISSDGISLQCRLSFRHIPPIDMHGSKRTVILILKRKPIIILGDLQGKRGQRLPEKPERLTPYTGFVCDIEQNRA